DAALRLALATKVFAHTARYDGAIANWLSALAPDGGRAAWPGVLTLQLHKLQDLRYGENPHQTAAFYRDARPAEGSLATFKQLQGKELSYNNIPDADAAWSCVKSFDAPACVIVKHANPCGVAIPGGTAGAYRLAFAADRTQACGGIIAFSRPLDGATGAEVTRRFVEVLIAPGFSAGALAVMKAKQNVRVLEIPVARDGNGMDLKR